MKQSRKETKSTWIKMPNTVVNPEVTQLSKLQNNEKETLEAR